jgi:5-methylcytosine-specific restriction endonuclease McrA
VLDKAFSIKDSDKIVRSQNLTIKIPEVLVLKNVNYIKRGFTAFSKKAVMKRDQVCQLCGESDKTKLTLEHLIPKSRWEKISKERGLTYGLNSFENCVILCKKDNQWKSDALPEEIGWEFTAKAPLVDFDINWDEIFGINN